LLQKLSRRLKIGIIALETILVLSIAALGYNFLFPLGKGSKLIYFDDSNLTKIIHILKKNGYNITGLDYYMINKTSLPQKGWYYMEDTEKGRYHFFKHLHTKPAPAMNIKIFAGETHTELLHRLAEDMKLNEKKLHTLYSRMAHYEEGDIFAGLYTVAREADEKTVLAYLFKRSQEKLEHFNQRNFIHQMDDSAFKLLLTIASIVQKESNDPKEMPIIASVIYNRLEKNMRLQMDGTLNYGHFSHQIVTSERIKSDTSFYNTYKYRGLPPAPLATVSMSALKAAMFPAKSDYLFFMLHKDGGHRFSKTYSEHLVHLKNFRNYQKERKKLLATKSKPSPDSDFKQ